MSSSMPYLAIAASVSPPPAMLNAGDAAIARAMVSVPLREGVELEHADRAVPDDRAGRLQLIAASVAARLRADVEDQVVGGDVGGRLDGRRARRP